MTGRIVCFDAADQRAYQARIERAESAAAEVEAVQGRITAEIMVKALAGMNDPTLGATLPYLHWPASANRGKVLQQSVADAVFDLLSDNANLSALMQVLQHSQCPRVGVFKVGLARAYAEAHAGDLAQHECDQ